MNLNMSITQHVSQVVFGLWIIAASSSLIAQSNAEQLEAGFVQPKHESGIRAFWWWLNSNVTPEAITRDLEEMKAKGFNGALIFDADGSAQRGHDQVPAGPAFGSPAWTKLWIHACKEAHRLNLELSLNLQSGWNLGGPSVTAAEAPQRLVFSKLEVKGGKTIHLTIKKPTTKDQHYKDIMVLAVPIVEGKRIPIKNLQLKDASRALGMAAPDCRFLLDTQPAVPGEAVVDTKAIINLTDKMNKQGKLNWNAPAGSWEIIRVGHTATGAHVSTHTQGAGGRVINYLCPEMLDRYWKRKIDPLMKVIGPLAGTTVKYVHTDSWEGGGMNWTPGFADEFRQRRGYDIVPWVPVLAGHVVESREASNAFLADFRKTVADLVGDHYARLAELAAQYGMGTHPECSGPHAGPLDGLKNYGRSELMMSEFWSPSPHRPTPERRFYVKQASSAAHTYGKQLVGAEGFTTIGPHWNDVAWRDMKPSFDREFCAGLNLLYVHTFTCSPKEMGLPGQEYFAGTHFNPQITWWDESTALIDYMRRCQYLAQQGKFVADVLHYYGDHIPNIFGRKAADPAGALPGYDYDVLSEELLVNQLEVKDGALELPSGMRYRVLSLPDHKILSLAALKKIDSLVRAGATVLGPKPKKAVSLSGGEDRTKVFTRLADGLWGVKAETTKGSRSVDKGRVVWGMTSSKWLQNDGVIPDVGWKLGASDKADIDWIHYRIGDADVYFVSELAGHPVDTTFTFRIDGHIPELWNPIDGSTRVAAAYQIKEGRTHLPLKLGAYDSLFVVFRKPAGQSLAGNGRSNGLSWMPIQSIEGPWKVSFNPEWGGPNDPVYFTKLIDWLDHPQPAINNYSGKAVYQTNFHVKSTQDIKAIELGEVRGVGIARVKLNGVNLGVAWRPPFRVKIADALKVGDNRLEVKVFNSWHNRVMADEKLTKSKRYTRTNIRVEKKGRFAWKPEPSG
ncbi:MAG: glycoside hydrolase, partial [Verrucomicrobiae bacterium]|nr:glycoside hydrolase [Verrucomicrobiae bacterium]NNJ86770.1 glycoside hydrolase [Akkermansiaceae bacterium]